VEQRYARLIWNMAESRLGGRAGFEDILVTLVGQLSPFICLCLHAYSTYPQSRQIGAQ